MKLLTKEIRVLIVAFCALLLGGCWSSRFYDRCDYLRVPTVSLGGESYPTIKIGEQVWLMKNVDSGDPVIIGQSIIDPVTQKYCYENDSAKCDKYGGLYTHGASGEMAGEGSSKSVCPAGWHVPSLAEWQELSDSVSGDGRALLTVGQGAGSNASCFSALLGGYTDASQSVGLGDVASFWATDVVSDSMAWTVSVDKHGDISNGTANKLNGHSIRCVKNRRSKESR